MPFFYPALCTSGPRVLDGVALPKRFPACSPALSSSSSSSPIILIVFPTPHFDAQVGELRVEARWLQKHDASSAERQRGSAASRGQHAQAHSQTLAATVAVFPEPSTRSEGQQDGKLRCCKVARPRRREVPCCRAEPACAYEPLRKSFLLDFQQERD
jgi:hypothetical protein